MLEDFMPLHVSAIHSVRARSPCHVQFKKFVWAKKKLMKALVILPSDKNSFEAGKNNLFGIALWHC
jgi:hypothetical protein